MDDIMPGFSGAEQTNTAWSPETATADAQASVENPFANIVTPNGPEAVLPQMPDSLDQNGPGVKFNIDPTPTEAPSYNAVQVETSFPETVEATPEPAFEATETEEVAEGADPEAILESAADSVEEGSDAVEIFQKAESGFEEMLKMAEQQREFNKTAEEKTRESLKKKENEVIELKDQLKEIQDQGNRIDGVIDVLKKKQPSPELKEAA